jgi:hypothetical protein
VYLGGTLDSSRTHITFKMVVLGKLVALVTCPPAGAAAGAHLYDAAQLLLRGHYAATNYEWSNYKPVDLATAAKVLQSRGVDICRAVHAARKAHAGDPWLGVQPAAAGCWRAELKCRLGDTGGVVILRSPELPSAEDAARRADRWTMAFKGLASVTNFPASTCSQEDLLRASEDAVRRRGLVRVRVQENVDAIQQV